MSTDGQNYPKGVIHFCAYVFLVMCKLIDINGTATNVKRSLQLGL